MRPFVRIIAIVALAVAAIDTRADLVFAQGRGQDSDGRRARPRETATNNLYIVRMAELPVAMYEGGVPAYPATRPGRGSKIDPNSPAVSSYANYLVGRHSQIVGRIGGRKVHDFKYTFNGFVAELTETQAERVKAQAGVLSVTKDELRSTTTSDTPSFLGLDAPGGLWDRLGGVDDAGEDIVVGVIDSGVWPENPSFSDRTDSRRHGKKGKKSYGALRGWHGTCQAGESFPASSCNRKLVGARHYNAAWGGDAGLKAQRPWEFASARDYNGHGTHTASTAGGNHDVALTGPAAIFGSISGMAPRARISVYKALWSTQDGSLASGFLSDIVAAIDQAVADGVDVINLSVEGTQANFFDPTQIAFLIAADAGIFVAASAGNDGQPLTVAHPAPWVTTVAAGTHNRSGLGSVQLGNNATYSGPSFATAVGPAPLINAAVAGVTGADPNAVRLCFTAADNGGTPALDPAKVTGKIIVCDRGVSGRTAKSLAVRDAGGVGMILVNTGPNSLNADFHFVPSIHLSHTDGAAVKAYAATAGATARINQATVVFNVPAPFRAAFSSQGPSLASGDLIKPDVIAPGQDIVAAVAPPGNGGRSFDVYSGTSMSSPHVAGLAALLKNQHPNWSPMMIKSALMTTGTDILDGDNTDPAVIFGQGAGHVAPNDAASPGLVYDSDVNDWIAFLCGATDGIVPAACAALAAEGHSLDPTDLNLASIAVGALAGSKTITRTVTNVTHGWATFTASTTGLEGFEVTVTPSRLTLGRGQSKSFTMTITRTTAPINTYAGGQLIWADRHHTVRSPIVVNPVALSAPAEVSGTGGPLNYNVTFGYTGPFTATARGLVAAELDTGPITDDPNDSFDPAGPGVVAIPVVIPAGTTRARFSLFDANVTPASDLDLYVFRGNTFVGGSGSGTSAEEVNLLNPEADTYTVYVHGFTVPNTGATFTLFSWVLGSTAAGNMTVTAPANATTGETGTINLTFSGLAAGTKYMGSVVYGGADGMPTPTVVRIDTP
jgi:subtilisin family serine protease